tara:strand:- start:947 stop:2290 length:1344 start_codon:yes stop_codon:yes gene_type:complete
MKNLAYNPIKLLCFVFLIGILTRCQKSSTPITISTDTYHTSVDMVTDIMIHDIISPPVASRVFAYPNVAAYEILVQKDTTYASLVHTANGLNSLPQIEADKNINANVAALIAHLEVSKMLIFSKEKLDVLKDSLYQKWKKTNEQEFLASQTYALKVVSHIKKWMDADFYNQTRNMPKYTVDTESVSRWQPTSPAYMDAIEPHWNKIRPFLLQSADQFKPLPHPEFSLKKDSDFYKELLEVYAISERITEKGDQSEELAIAKFWDCNPYVSVTRGHFMFATKKITPGAHWIGIVKIATQKTNANLMQTVNAYAKTSLAIADAFISCWDEKYSTNLIRPETLIHQNIDSDWLPILQTPPFPEYTSGHSVVSGAASVVLTTLFGDDFAFDDDTELQFGLPVRSFSSFYDASSEAAISRMYGGIHYRAAVDNGLEQGKKLGHFVVQKIRKK